MEKRRITFNVTKEHIRRGEAGSRNACPIALALSEVVAEPVVVAHDAIWAGVARAPHTAKTTAFVRWVDCTFVLVQPFTATITFDRPVRLA